MMRGSLVILAILTLASPAFAQVNLAGTYNGRVHEDSQERSLGPDLVDYLGLPLNDDARARALSYSASQLAMLERQCLPYAPNYILYAPAGLSLWSDIDPTTGVVVAWNIGGIGDRAAVRIWMDDRPHPSENAPHTFGGFTTGRWEGNVLVAYSTHFKGGYLRRNGVALSDEATLTMHITRHSDVLTIIGIMEDPAYLTRPHLVSRSWQLNPNAIRVNTGLNALCSPEAEVANLQGDGLVLPHYLPGQNPFLSEMARRYNLPLDAVLGGEQTIYPEYRKQLKDAYVPPASCVRYCCGWDAMFPILAPGLRCITDGSGRPTEP